MKHKFKNTHYNKLLMIIIHMLQQNTRYIVIYKFIVIQDRWWNDTQRSPKPEKVES